jgi:hypothetical protein
MAISNFLLGTTPANIYVSSGNTVISTMYFCNTDTSARNFNVYLIPSAGNFTANTFTQIYKDVQLAANDTYVMDMEKLVLGPGDQLRANCTSAGVVTATVSYVGI